MLHPSWKSWTFIGIFSLLILAAGWILGERSGIFWAVPVVLSINYFLLFHQGFKALPFHEQETLEGHDSWRMVETAKRLSEKAGLPAPQLMRVEAPTPQAFLLGRTQRGSCIYVTQGVLDRFTPAEQEALLAWTIAVLKNRLHFNFLVLGAFSYLVFQLNFFIDKFLIWALGARSRFPNSLFLWFNWPLFFVVQRWNLSSRDYLDIDAAAAELLGSKEALCRALLKLESYADTRPLKASPAWLHTFIVSPLSQKGPLRYLQPHPSVKKRITHLVGAYPI